MAHNSDLCPGRCRFSLQICHRSLRPFLFRVPNPKHCSCNRFNLVDRTWSKRLAARLQRQNSSMVCSLTNKNKASVRSRVIFSRIGWWPWDLTTKKKKWTLGLMGNIPDHTIKHKHFEIVKFLLLHLNPRREEQLSEQASKQAGQWQPR